MAVYINSLRGKRKLRDSSNYTYDLHSRSETLMREYWRCDVRKLCKVWIHTSSAEVSPVILHVAGEHNHPASVDSVEAKVVVSELKKDAVSNSSSTPRALLASKYQQ